LKRLEFDPGKRISNSKHESKESYLLYLRHLFAYQFVLANFSSRFDTLLEIGIGTGYGLELLKSNFKRIIGVDIDFLKNKEDYIFIQSDANYLPFKSQTFSFIISFQVIEHIEDDIGFLKEIFRVMKEKGMFVLSTVNAKYRIKKGKKPWNKYHVREYFEDELEGLLKKVFPSVEIFGVRAKKDIEKVEKLRAKRCIFPTNYILPLLDIFKRKDKDYVGKYNINDFYVTKENLDESLDFIAVCKKL